MLFNIQRTVVNIKSEKLVSVEEQKKYLLLNGWETWFSINNWIHPKTISDTKIQYYFNTYMKLNYAYCFEKLNLPGIPPFLATTIEKFLLENKQVRELLRTLVQEELT